MLFVDALAAAKREFSPNSAMTEVISGPDIVVFVSLKVGPTGQLDRVDSGVGLEHSQLADTHAMYVC